MYKLIVLWQFTKNVVNLGADEHTQMWPTSQVSLCNSTVNITMRYLHLLPCPWEGGDNVHKAVMIGSCLLQCPHVHMQACSYSSTHKQ